MLGFVRNPQTQKMVKTGIIYASTNPPGADIYINDLKAHESTPTVVRDLPPGNYSIRLDLKGYQPWQNTVPVVARKATVLENILLIPQEWSVKILNFLTFDNILALGDGTTLLAWQEKTIKDLYILKLNKEPSDDKNTESEVSLLNAVFPEEFIYSEAQILKFFTVDKSPYFIVQVFIAQKHKYLWVDVRDKQIHIEDVSDLLPQEPLKLWWEPTDERNIYAFYNDHTNRVDIKTKAIYPNITFKDIPLNKTKSLGAPEASISDENNATWLQWTTHKIGLWDKNQKNTQWIFEDGRDIQQAFWANNSNTVLFRDGTKVFLLDKMSVGQTRLQKIVDVYNDTSIYYSEKTGQLYYIDPKKQYLSMINVVRHKLVLPKRIADTLRLKESEP
jgi:hypothetical protein